MTHEQIVSALQTLKPNAEWILRGETLDGLVWLDMEQSMPTIEEIEAIINQD